MASSLEVAAGSVPQSAPAAGSETDGTTIDVLVHGRPSVDLTFLGLPHLPRLGEEYRVTGFDINPGATFINASAMRRLGLRVGYAADVGCDFFSRFALEHLRAADIDERFVVFHDRDLTNLSAGLSFPEDRTFITWDAGAGMQERGVLLDDLRHYHVRCLFTHHTYAPEVYQEAQRQHVPIVFDAYWDRDYLESDRVFESLAQADAFIPNQVEACTITRRHDPRQALAALEGRVKMLVIKLGREGAIGCLNGHRYFVPAVPVDAVDTTGAGDNFAAGFIYGLMHDFAFEHCIRCGVAAGSLSTLQMGGVKGSPTEEELLAFVDRIAYQARKMD